MGQTQTKWTFSKLMELYRMNPREARKVHAEKHAAMLEALRAYSDLLCRSGRPDGNLAQVLILKKGNAEDEHRVAKTTLALLENPLFRRSLQTLVTHWQNLRISQTSLRDDRFEEFLDRAAPELHPEIRFAWADIHSIMEPVVANPSPSTGLTL